MHQGFSVWGLGFNVQGLGFRSLKSYTYMYVKYGILKTGPPRKRDLSLGSYPHQGPGVNSGLGGLRDLSSCRF